MRKYTFIVALLAGLSNPALANPVYLHCVLKTPQGQQDWDIALNEEQGRVVTEVAGNLSTSSADFGPYVIKWGREGVGELSLMRTTGQFLRMFYMPKVELSQGHCAVVDRKLVF